LSLFVLILFAGIGLSALFGRKKRSRAIEVFFLLVAAVLSFFLFPVAQIYTFGTTDYARKADVMVVLGAAVRSDGEPSLALKSRLDHAIELYDAGFAPKIIMSGGIDAGGRNEPRAMRAYAVRKGVPADAILLDDKGKDTDNTVAHTIPLIEELGAKTILADSHFYHLPRIKMAYRAQRVNVLTTPCDPHPLDKLPVAVAREIPAFWLYWLRSGVRSVR
jgi:vancomycin permeability regulator SanA